MRKSANRERIKYRSRFASAEGFVAPLISDSTAALKEASVNMLLFVLPSSFSFSKMFSSQETIVVVEVGENYFLIRTFLHKGEV